MFNGKIRYTQLYAVTVTLCPKVRRDTAEKQYEKYAHDVVLGSLKTFFPNCKLTLICELTKSYDLHFHGIIQFVMGPKNRNWPKYFRDQFRNHNIIGFVLLKVIDDDTKWKEYILKSIEEFIESTNGLQPVIVDDFDIYFPNILSFKDENAQDAS